jgi:hypothetical protein
MGVRVGDVVADSGSGAFAPVSGLRVRRKDGNRNRSAPLLAAGVRANRNRTDRWGQLPRVSSLVARLLGTSSDWDTGGFLIPLRWPGGALVLLTLFGWRRPEARLLIAMSPVPQYPTSYDYLPLAFILGFS